MFKTIVVCIAVLLCGALAADSYAAGAEAPGLDFAIFDRGGPPPEVSVAQGADFFADGGSFNRAHISGGGDKRWRGIGTGWDTGFVVGEAGLWSLSGDLSVPTIPLLSIIARVDLMIGILEPIIGIAFDTGVRFHFDLHRKVTMYVDAKASIAAFDSGVWASAAGIAGTFGVEFGDAYTRLYGEVGLRMMAPFRVGGNPLTATPDFGRDDMRRLAGLQFAILRIGFRVYMR